MDATRGREAKNGSERGRYVYSCDDAVNPVAVLLRRISGPYSGRGRRGKREGGRGHLVAIVRVRERRSNYAVVGALVW